MNRYMLSLLVVFCACASSYGQKNDEAIIAAKVEELRKALLDPERDKLDKLTHADLSYGHSSGVLENKEAFMQALLSEDSDFTDIQLSEQTIKVTGNTAVVRHKMVGAIHNKGKEPATLNLGVLLVWTKDKSDWKLLARQAFKL